MGVKSFNVDMDMIVKRSLEKEEVDTPFLLSTPKNKEMREQMDQEAPSVIPSAPLPDEDEETSAAGSPTTEEERATPSVEPPEEEPLSGVISEESVLDRDSDVVSDYKRKFLGDYSAPASDLRVSISDEFVMKIRLMQLLTPGVSVYSYVNSILKEHFELYSEISALTDRITTVLNGGSLLEVSDHHPTTH